METDKGASSQVVSSSYEQMLIDINNAQLNLAETPEFRADNPVAGITSVTVKRLYTNSVGVTCIWLGFSTVSIADALTN